MGRGRWMIGKNMFIETNMSGYIYPFGGRIKTPVAMVNRAVAKEDTRSGVKINLVAVIWTKIGKTLTSKDSKKRAIRFAFKNMFIGRFVGGDTR